MRLLVLGVPIAAAVKLVTSGHVLFLPLLLVLPVGGVLFGGRRRDRDPRGSRRQERRRVWW